MDVQMPFHLPIHREKLVFFIFAVYFTTMHQNKKKIDSTSYFQLALCGTVPQKHKIPELPQNFLDKRRTPFQPNILPIRSLQPGADESLANWTTKCTLDFQLLDMTPKNLTEVIALLQLLGISSISLSSLGRKRGGTACFLISIPNAPLNVAPILIRDTDQILNCIEEFRKGTHPIRSLEPSIADAKDHILPRLRQQIEADIENNVVLQLYQDIINANDTDLRYFCEQFLGKEYRHSQQWMFEQLKKAQNLCRETINSEQITNPSMKNG